MEQTKQPSIKKQFKPHPSQAQKKSGKPKNGRWTKKRRGGSTGSQQNRTASSRAPRKLYVSDCCNLQALKPRCGQMEAVVDPQTKKTKDQPRGLGHWRCTGCKKACKVSVTKYPAPETASATAVVPVALADALSAQATAA